MRYSVLKIGGLTPAALALASLLLPAAQEKAPPFDPGETLTYDVTWSIFRAGTVTATLEGEGQGSKNNYTVTTTAHSQGFVSLLFTVQNEFRSSFNPRTLCSERISKKVNEGRRHKETEVVFDSQRKLAILDERDLTKPHEPPKHAENEIPNCVEDVVTAFYYSRSQDFQIAKSLHMPVNDGSKTYDVTLEVQARETIQTPLGKRLALRVEPKVFNGLFKRKGRMLVWFSDDDQHLPLRIKFIIAVGPLTATLKSVTRVPDQTLEPGAITK
jgi:stress response protein SCP2